MEYRGPVVENWWVLAIGGIFSILFGLAALFWPGITLFVLVWLFAVYAIAYGLVELVNMFRTHETWWVHLLVGLISLGAGVAVLAWPGITSLVLLYAIAFWAIGVGIAEVLAGLFQAQLGWLVAGVISVLFGIVLMANPIGGALSLILVIGIFAIVHGILLLVAAIRTPSPTHTTM